MSDTREKLREEYKTAEAKKVLDDTEFNRIYEMSADEIIALPDEKRKAFFMTSKYHASQRMSLDSIEGIEVGGKPITHQ